MLSDPVEALDDIELHTESLALCLLMISIQWPSASQHVYMTW